MSYDNETLFKLTIPLLARPIETEKAWGFKMDNGEVVFVPKSQMREVDVQQTEAAFLLPAWLVVQKSLEVFVEDDGFSFLD